MAVSDDEVVSNASHNTHFTDIVAARISRRGVLGGGVAMMAAGVLGGGVGQLLTSRRAGAQAAAVDGPEGGPLLGFAGIPTSTLDTVVVPPGYRWEVLIAWGDPVSERPGLRPGRQQHRGRPGAPVGHAQRRHRLLPASRAPVAASSCRTTSTPTTACSSPTAWPTGTPRRRASRRPPTACRSSRSSSVIAGGRSAGRPATPAGSPPTRRSAIAGPAAGHALLQTGADPTGTRCSARSTTAPWASRRGARTWPARRTSTGTSARRRNGPARDPLRHRRDQPVPLAHDRYPLRSRRRAQRGQPLRLGDRDRSVPPRLDAGQAHGARPPEARGRVGRGDRRQAGRRVHGRRRALRVHLPLRLQPAVAEGLPRGRPPARRRHPLRRPVQRRRHRRLVAAHDRQPGVGGLRQPGRHPHQRPRGGRRGGRHEDGPSRVDRRPRPQEGGVRHPHQQHPSRRRPATRGPTPPTPAPTTSTATSCAGATRRTSATRSSPGTSSPWPATRRSRRTGSTIVGDKYGSPDGLYVAPSGRLWIQTDVSTSTIDTGAYAGFGNNQMLCANPTTKETRRFLVGPKQCEITGVVRDARRANDVRRHPAPGRAARRHARQPGQSQGVQLLPGWAAGGRPRSSLIVITKDDGGKIGS